LDLDNPVIKLCIEGSRAEFESRPEDAKQLYWQAWETSGNDYEACIAAHYMARFQAEPGDIFYWNQEALNRAQKVVDGRVDDFYPSLYLNMGRSYEILGNLEEAARYYKMAADLGAVHQPGEV
jgi:tetratricopeptide (TPR) repeat protein